MELTRRELGEIEKFYIKAFRSNDPTIGYNMTKGGDGGIGHPAGISHPAFGQKPNSGSFQKGHKRCLGRTRPGVSKRMKENNPLRMAGVLEKISAAKLGKHYSPSTEFKKGMVPWNKGRKKSNYLTLS